MSMLQCQVYREDNCWFYMIHVSIVEDIGLILISVYQCQMHRIHSCFCLFDASSNHEEVRTRIFQSMPRERRKIKCSCFMIIVPTVEEKDLVFLLSVPRAERIQLLLFI